MSEWNAQAVDRIIRAHGRKVAGTGTEVDLEELAQLRATLEVAIGVAVVGLRSRDCSWANIGDALGVSKQAAYQRYGQGARS